MLWLSFIYIAITVIVSAFMAFGQSSTIWGAAALLISSLLGFAGGSGMRGAFYLGQRTSGIVIGLALLAAGMALAYYSEVTLQMFGARFSADVWVFIGFVIGFLAARPQDAGVEIDQGSRSR